MEDRGEQREQLAAVQRMFREVLQARGFAYCDSGLDQDTAPLPEGLEAQPLIAAGVHASSTDHPTQSIARTLEESNNTFWSSRGSATPDTDAQLLYKLRGPLCVVQYVQIIVYRARYQFGEPIYPPLSVSFQVGPSPASLAPPTARYSVQPSARVQTFLLPAGLPVGRFLQVNLHGRRQQQLEDLQWYLAVERVQAFGRQLSLAETAKLRSWSQGVSPTLPAPGSLPAHLVAWALLPEHRRSPTQGGGTGSGGGSRDQQQRRQAEQQQQQQPGGVGAGGRAGRDGLEEGPAVGGGEEEDEEEENPEQLLAALLGLRFRREEEEGESGSSTDSGSFHG